MIPLVEDIDGVRHAVRMARASGKIIGLVPTMGALHAGHIRLIDQARAESDYVVVTIFVNPTQFGPSEDFDKYPRTLDLDRLSCEGAGADLIFAPTIPTLYPRGTSTTFVEVPGLSDVLEGAIRPGHFRGVATVVLKLCAIVSPDYAYFGQKDFQQQVLIRRMVSDLCLPITIITVPTVRESDGLALSSRNRYLDPSEREAATILSRALSGAVRVVSDGERDVDRVRQILRDIIQSERRAGLDYVEVADAETLEPLVRLTEGRKAVALVAARIGRTRLIDNAILMD